MSAQAPGDVVEAIRQARADGSPLEVRGGGSVLALLPAAPGAPDPVLDVSGLRGVVEHAASDLTITVGAGTPLDELVAELAAAGQECPIEPPTVDDPPARLGSTVGGRVATALAGPRQRGAGRVRDWLLRVAFVTGDGRPSKAGGRTVKDVTGYDLCRLLAGSWGTLAVLTEVTLKVRPIPPHRAWYATDAPRERWLGALHDPATVVAVPGRTTVLLEGHPDDCADQARVAGLEPVEAPPARPAAARAAVDPARLDELLAALDAQGCDWAGDVGVGVVDVGGDAAQLAEVRAAAVRLGGRLLALGGDGQVPAFGGPPDGEPFAGRLAAALDPDGVLAPWRWSR